MENTKRKTAIEWWNSLTNLEKSEFTTLIINPKRSYRSLTGREIEKIYNWNFE